MSATATITAQDILDEIKPLGSDSYKRILANHGITGPCYGVKIEHLKKIQKRIKTHYQLALDLFDTGVYDAMYLAGLIADDAKMTKKDLQRWIAKSTSQALCEYTVAWVASGWCTLSGLVALKDDSELDVKEIKQLLQRVTKTIHDQPNCVRYVMNGFVIAVGSYIKSLTDDAIAAAKKIGKVSVDVGNTACKVPDAAAYIDKVKQRGSLGKKRKTVKC